MEDIQDIIKDAVCQSYKEVYEDLSATLFVDSPVQEQEGETQTTSSTSSNQRTSSKDIRSKADRRAKVERVKKIANRISIFRKEIEDIKIKMRGTNNPQFKELLGRTIDQKRTQIRELERAMSGK